MEKQRVIVDPWGSILIKDYEKLVEEFGLEPFTEEQLSKLPKPNKLMRRGVVFASRDLDSIITAIKRRKKYYALTGIVPSSDKIHFGNKMIVELMSYFQKNGAETYMLIADLEAAAARGVSLEEARKRALEFHVPAYIALGLNPRKTKFYFQSQNRDVMNFASIFSKKVTENEFKAIYGNLQPGRIFSSLIQVADILYPQFKERMPGIIPIGIDQDPHMRLTRDIVKKFKKFNFFSPSSIYPKYTPSLDGSFKMSKSSPGSYISIPDDPEKAAAKMKRALTGGRDTVEEQKKLGGIPEKCMIFEMYKQHLIKNDKELERIYKRCKAGKLLCKEDKENSAKLMKKFLKEFNRKFKRAKKKVPRYLRKVK
jgi:tryptophanyl-tRNA synthetase